jgi:hypothetical protein
MKGDNSVPPPTDEEKKKLLQEWSAIVEKECADIISVKEQRTEEYLKTKNKYEKWIAAKLKRVQILEKRLIARKAQLKEIQTELALLTNTSK